MFAFKEQRLRIRSLDGFVTGALLSFLGIILGIMGTLLASQWNAGGIIVLFLFSGLIQLYGLSKVLLAFNDTRKVVEIRNILNEVAPDIADSDIVDWL